MFLWFGIYYSTARGFCKKHPLSPAKREKSLKKTSLFPFTRQKLPGGGVPSQSRLPPCQLPQRGSQVCALPKACAKPSLASPFGGGGLALARTERASCQRPPRMGCVEALAGCPLSHGWRRASSPKGGAKSRLPLWGRCHAKGMTERARCQRPLRMGCVEALASCPLSRLAATAPPKGEPSLASPFGGGVMPLA